MLKHPEINCLTSSYWELNVDAQRVNKYDPSDMTREMFEGANFTWMHSSACYRKEDILKLPYRKEEGKTDDWVFLDDWTKAGMKFHTLKKELADCRRLPGGVMQMRRQSQGLQPSYIL
jgi:hypothetical protein